MVQFFYRICIYIWPKNAGQDVGDHDNPYIRLGSIVTVDLVKFSYQIASGMVSVFHHELDSI